MKVVIVGGVAGGATAAARLRRLDEKAEIIIFEKSGFISYANCGLPYYIGGVIEDKRDLTLQTPKSFWNRFRINAKVHHEVIKINRNQKTVTVKNLETAEVFEESYDKLVLSPGGRPVVPDYPGVDLDRIFTLRTVEDTYRIREAVLSLKNKRSRCGTLSDFSTNQEKISSCSTGEGLSSATGNVNYKTEQNSDAKIINMTPSAVVIGGGFIGVEMAENLKEAGLNVTLVQRSDHILPPMDSDMASFLHAHIRKKGVRLLLNQKVKGFEKSANGSENSDETEKAVNLEGKNADNKICSAKGDNNGAEIKIKACSEKEDNNETNTKIKTYTAEEDGKRSDSKIKICLEGREPIEADIVVLAVGVQPDSSLAKEAGLELGPKDSIMVDDHMRTSDPDIYAAGDAVSIKNFVTGKKAVIALAGPANKEGRIIANNIAGLDSAYKGTPGSSILKVFDMTAAFTGLNEKSAKAEGYEYEKVIISPASHASYYPGGTAMTLKLLYEKATEKILGAQIAGFDGVDKRLDVIATAMQAGLKVTDLADLELSYAPPYSSAKDPVNMAGFVAGNIVSGRVKQFYFEDMEQLLKIKDNDGAYKYDSNNRTLNNKKQNADNSGRKGIILLDTRTTFEYSRGHAEGFDINIPVDELRERLGELDKTKPVYVMCQSALRSYIACRILSQEGFECFNFAGGYRLYESIMRDRFDEGCRTDCGAPHR